MLLLRSNRALAELSEGVFFMVKIQMSSSCWPTQPPCRAERTLVSAADWHWMVSWVVHSFLIVLDSWEGGCLPWAEGMQAEQMERPFKFCLVELKSEKWLTGGSLPFEELVYLRALQSALGLA